MEFLDPSKLTELAKVPFSTWFIYVVIGLGTAVAAGISYLKGKQEQSTPSSNVVIREGSIADMQPIREMAVHIKEIAHAVKTMNTLIHQEVARRREEEVNDLKDENMSLRMELINIKRRLDLGGK